LAASSKPASHRGIGHAWVEDSAARDILLMLKDAALDRGAPVPLCRQQETLTGRSSERRSYLVERGVAYPGAAVSHGGATAEEKRRQTILAGQVNAAIAELREHIEDDLDPPGAKPTWPEQVLHDIYDVGTEPLERPKLGKDLFRAAALLWDWREANKRWAQRKIPSPAYACKRLKGPVPGFSTPDGPACGWRGGQCCRHVSCPLNDCRVAWVAHRGDIGRCDDD
jgi:hypothetical protein